jgi:pyruvate kinase
MNLPGSMVSAPAVTEHDREEVERVVALGIEFLGVSFVRRPEDVEELRRIIPKNVKLIAKIEKDSALAKLDGILEASDAIMVARGDLGVELPFEAVPLVQKRLIQRANRHGKPVITATQMLESMVTNPRPTRAEVSDVANAILDGTDAVMLSAETAVGQYPREAVLAMDRIAREVETHRHRPGEGERRRWQIPPSHFARTTEGQTPTEDAIAVAVSAAADLLGAQVIVCFTSSGFTARTVSSYRPKVPILALTSEPETYRQLGLAWGVVPVLMPHLKHYDPMWAIARTEILARGLAREGSRIVVTCGVPFDIPGTTNLLKVETL